MGKNASRKKQRRAAEKLNPVPVPKPAATPQLEKMQVRVGQVIGVPVHGKLIEILAQQSLRNLADVADQPVLLTDVEVSHRDGFPMLTAYLKIMPRPVVAVVPAPAPAAAPAPAPEPASGKKDDKGATPTSKG